MNDSTAEPRGVPDEDLAQSEQAHVVAHDEATQSIQFDRLRVLVALALTRGADRADQHDFTKLAAHFKEIKQAAPRLPYKRWRKLYVALGFWACWIAEAEQGFPVNALVSGDAWSRLARLLAEDLQHNRDVSDPQIRAIADLSGSFGAQHKG